VELLQLSIKEEKGQIQELALAIERLLLDKDLRTKMGKEGRKIAEAEFSIVNVIIKKINDIDKNIAENNVIKLALIVSFSSFLNRLTRLFCYI
jgi:hypothetical protein